MEHQSLTDIPRQSDRGERSRSGSYQIEKIAFNVDKEIERLQYQVELFWKEELFQHKKAGVKDGMTILEVGSGPGFLTERLAREFPHSTIICVERDPRLIQFARSHCRQYHQIEYIQSAVEELKQGERKIDVVIARLLIEHLVDPMETVCMLYSLLGKDGILNVIDNDFELHTVTYPESPSLRCFFDAYCRAKEDEGGSPRIARALPLLLKKAGFSDVYITALVAHNQLHGNEVFLKSEGLGIPLQLVKKGYMSSQTLGQISKEWKNVLAAQEHCIMRQVLFATGVKK